MEEKDLVFMKEALRCAARAARIGEIPVGAVVVKDGRILSRGYNRREIDKNALRHAEITALDRACKRLGGWRLSGCDLYVTMEPCPMCAGAIVNARIRRVVFGAYDPKAGSFGSVLHLNDFPYNHRPEIKGGVLREECAALLSDFFKRLRAEKNKKKATAEL